MKKILFITTSLGSGGAERNISLLANFFCDHNCKVYILILDQNKIFYSFNDSIKILKSRRLGDYPKQRKILCWLKEIRFFVKKYNIETVISIGLKYALITCLSLLHKKKIRIIMRGTNTYNFSNVERFFLNLLGFRLNVIVCQTKAQKKLYKVKFQKKCVLIPNPFQTYDANRNLTKISDSKKIICIGRFNLDTKNQLFIAKSFLKFWMSHREYSLYFYGKDFNGGIKKMTRFLEIEDKFHCVHIEGEKKDIANYIVGSKLFLCASSVEGMPNAIIESLMLGVPCISTNWLGANEIILNGENGFLLPNDVYNTSTDEYSNAIEKFVNLGSDQLLTMSNKSCLINKELYDKNRVLDKWLKLILDN